MGRRLLGDSTTTSFKISDSPKTFSSSAKKADAIRATMVQNTQNASLGLLVEGVSDSASTSSVLTPTTTKILTDLFQSENCIAKLETIEDEGFVVPLPPAAAPTVTALNKETSGNRKSFIKLDSNSWQGGTTTVVTPTNSEKLTILDVPSSLKSMKTRSSNRVNRTVVTMQSQPKRQETQPKRQANIKRTPKSRPGVKATTDESGLSPEEAEKLEIRRERNKAAAARCRKRRMDQISYLSDEVQEHEEKKLALENTIAQLKAQKEELEYILSQHQSECQLVVPGLQRQQPLPIAVKSEPVLVETIEMNPLDQVYMFEKPLQEPLQEIKFNSCQEIDTNRTGGLKAKRPLSLNIESAQNEARNSATLEGVLIDTPSNIISNLGFDTLMTSTGLTPTSNIVTPISFNITTSVPSCSSQQRSSEMVELNTPATENVSLVSL